MTIRDVVVIAATVVWVLFVLAFMATCDAAQPQFPCPAMFSEHHPAMDAEAQKHAEYMARVSIQGHQGFAVRIARLEQMVASRDFSEICAETWPWQKNDKPQQRWEEYVKCWKQSPGHWRTASRQHKYIGMGESQSKDGRWFGCIIAAD